MIACDISETKDYIPRCDLDLPADQQTVFVMRTFDAKTKARIQNAAAGVASDDQTDSVVELRAGDAQYELVRHGIPDWRNLRDRDGHNVPCQKTKAGRFEVLSEGSMNRITKILSELSAAIGAFNRMDEDDEGNFEASQPSSATQPGTSDQEVT